MAEGTRLFFGPYELRTDSGELFREGVPVKLQPQPARLLELLARRSGEVVAREEIQSHLWGEDTFVEFEQGLNFSIRKIRIALEDSAGQPRYLETVPRRGYRFLAPVRAELPAVEPPARQASRVLPWVAVLLALALVPLIPLWDRRLTGGDDPSPLSEQARQAYTEGRFLAHRRAPGDRDRALALLQEAILLAPDYAPAYATYARVWLAFSRPPKDVVAPAETAARQALALDPHLLQAQLVLVDIELYFRFNWRQARIELDRALALGPRDPDVHRAQAAYLAAHGRFDEALAAARQAQLLDPSSSVTAADLAWYSFLARRYDEALDLARRTLALEPTDTWTRGVMIEAALAVGEPGIALAEANEILRIVRSRSPAPVAPESFDSLRGFWEWTVQRWTARAAKSPIPPMDLVVPVLHLGDKERALRLLEKAARNKYGWQLAFLAVDPRLDPLRKEPRFQEILGSLKAPSLPSGLASAQPTGRSRRPRPPSSPTPRGCEASSRSRGSCGSGESGRAG